MLFQEVACRDIQGFGQLADDVDAGRVLAALDHSDVVAIDLSAIGKLFLTHSGSEPEISQIRREELPYSHGATESRDDHKHYPVY